jgi:hypothetical protein
LPKLFCLDSLDGATKTWINLIFCCIGIAQGSKVHTALTKTARVSVLKLRKCKLSLMNQMD